MPNSMSHHIQIFKSVFKGREDVFALRWESGRKGGYMPAYSYDPYLYRAHKMGGGTFQNFPDKKYLPLHDSEIAKHLRGEHLIGMYPLLPDNTTWFVAADFDDDKWLEECITFIKTCSDNQLPACLERSRSGSGGHVWVFFEQPYPAVRSRKIFLSLLQQSGVMSVFDKRSSFDRLFPNQDYLSGKGLGNLIALPLYKKTLDNGNSCFLNTETLQPYPDQFEFLNSIRRATVATLNQLFENLQSATPVAVEHITNTLSISLQQDVRLSRNSLSPALINFLKDELNFANSEYYIKSKAGKSTHETPRFFNFIEETSFEVIIPRGVIGKLLRFCMASKMDYTFHDLRKKQAFIDFQFNAQLRDYQLQALDTIAKKDFGVIVAPPGSGKTIIGLKIIADRNQPALIIVHRQQLVDQWMERIETFLGIPRHEIGRIGQGKSKTGSKITIATIQSLSKELTKSEGSKLTDLFGTIIVDECHHIPAKTYRESISKLSCYYLYGLTATPFRKYNDGRIIFYHLGDIIIEIKPTEIASYKQAKIIIQNTDLYIPFNSKTDQVETLSKILIHDTDRNNLILNAVVKELIQDRKVVIITERKEHIETLNQYLKQSYETVTLSGDDSATSRSSKWKILKDGNFQALITTGQYFGEGSDLQNIATLFLVYPFAFEGKLIQYIGRVQRSELTPTIYDFRDLKIDYLNKLFLKRNTYYRKIQKQATLFDEPTPEQKIETTSQNYEITITIPLEELDFRYGGVAFNYTFPSYSEPVEFEIENLHIRPELEILKPYFKKALNTKNITIELYAEFENGNLVAQLASSTDLDRLNNELVESVRFRYISEGLPVMKYTKSTNLLTAEELTNTKGNEPSLYNDGNQLLDELLSCKNYRHSRHIRYLADRHERSILKIRFVLSPFSFVFLLAGEQRYHIILETLDTDEATYIWHVEKNTDQLKVLLREIDDQLSFIRTNGRQAFLERRPEKFNRIVHDYRDIRKGFIVWKDMVEERID